MRIKRFVAPDMRQAIALVREEQGPDAVILSNQRVEGGIEIIAAVDYDADLMNDALGVTRSQHDARQRQRTPPPRPQTQREPATEATPPATETSATPRPQPEAGPPHEPAFAPAFSEMQREVAALRELLESQLSSLAWTDVSRRQPFRAGVLRELSRMGFDPALADEIAGELDGHTDKRAASRELVATLDARLPLMEEEIIDTGGIVALVGPTGVGKTTSVAKLAARFATKHGKDALALVTTDNFRIGAHEQLLTFARILGVPVHFVSDATQLARTLDELSAKSLVLIDTAGMSQRDLRLSDQLALLRGAHADIRVLLTLPAHTQRAALEDIMKRFAHLEPSGCVLTKLDETVSLGGALSVLIRHQLPLAYATDGQNVPEDIHWARSKKLGLVVRAIRLLKANGEKLDDDTLAMRFGEVLTSA